MSDVAMTSAGLRFSDRDAFEILVPDTLTAALGRPPTHSYIRGQPMTNKRGKVLRTPDGAPILARFSAWQYGVESREPGDLDGQIRELFGALTSDLSVWRGLAVFNLLGGEPEYLDPLRDETPEGWWVTGYPWSGIDTPEHKRFLDAYRKRWQDYPRLGSVVGYTAVHAIANAMKKAGSTDTEKLVAALKGLRMPSPFGEIEWRAIDHQSTMGAYVGQLSKKDGRGVMVDWHYVDGARVQPSDQEVRKLRPR